MSGEGSPPVVGFVGVGSIGRPMCLSVAGSGFPVVAYGARSRARSGLGGTEVAGSLAEVWRAVVGGHTAIYAFPEEFTRGEVGDVEENSVGTRRERRVDDAARERGSGGASSGTREEG